MKSAPALIRKKARRSVSPLSTNFGARCGAHVMATTHYGGLKMYAANDDDVLNASVEFDEKTLRPTYRLLVGLAGSSSGLEIARRFGIPAEIISSAAGQVKDSSRDATEYLRRIKREAEEATALRQALEEERADGRRKICRAGSAGRASRAGTPNNVPTRTHQNNQRIREPIA